MRNYAIQDHERDGQARGTNRHNECDKKKQKKTVDKSVNMGGKKNNEIVR